MYEKALEREEQRLLREINAQKGMSMRKLGKMIQLSAVIGTLERERNNGNYPRW